MELTPEEKALAEKIGFEEDVLGAVKGIASGVLEQLVNDDNKPVAGLAAALPAKPSKIESAILAEQIAALRRELCPRGYLVYRTSRDSSF